VFKIYIDADACPVKQETYRVAARHGLDVTLVANAWMRTPPRDSITLVVVGSGFDEADNWIADHVQANDIVITADVPLASRCIKRGACAIRPSGERFTEDDIGRAVADRDLMAELREAGLVTGGPPPLTQRDRSCFLQQLDNAVQSLKRREV